MDAFFERLIVRAATLDELLSDDFEPLPGQKGDADLAARRLAAWCRSCASGDWHQFARRLDRDRLAFGDVLAKLATVRRKASSPPPEWVNDAIWIEAAVRGQPDAPQRIAGPDQAGQFAFEPLFVPVVEQAEALVRSGVDEHAFGRLTEPARACLRVSLLRKLSGFAGPAIYERFDKSRKAGTTLGDVAGAQGDAKTSGYDQFVARLRDGEFRQFVEEKPVLLRQLALITRQWIEATQEFIRRLDADLPSIRRELANSRTGNRVARIEGDLADPHNGGRSVQIISFDDGTRVVYKPKDLRLDAAWHALVARLNLADPPLDLRAMRSLARDGYGWTEFVEHSECADQEDWQRFFRRAGAWLALFHCFAATDLHQENIIAAGAHPVPIDLETILQAGVKEPETSDPEDQAFEAALETVGNSVMMVGLLPTYSRSSDNGISVIGGMTSDWNVRVINGWNDLNTDRMRPSRRRVVGQSTPNLPYTGEGYARFDDHVEDFIAGFEDYARFLSRVNREHGPEWLFDGFAGLPVRRVIHQTQFYQLLLQRLRAHRSMDDGAIWSAQADFIARLADWDEKSDPRWPLLRAERSALLALNVPHFVSLSDRTMVHNAAGVSVHVDATPGIDRAKARIACFDEQEIAWQVTVIRQNTASATAESSAKGSAAAPPPLRAEGDSAAVGRSFIEEADAIADELARYAIRRGPGAAWIGLDSLRDSGVFQLVCLGGDLYNGVLGIAVFLAAHSAVTGRASSAELARAAVLHLRKEVRSPNMPRIARATGIGGGAGLGSVIYGLTVMSRCLGDRDLLADALATAQLFTDELIAADTQLNVMGGSAGAILGLLRLYRETHSGDVLSRASKCGDHILGRHPIGTEGRRSWSGQGSGPQDFNGISHGAAGFAYALASLAEATGRDEFAAAASECLAFENSSYDTERHNWPDLRDDGIAEWPCRWCHGATGIGLARIGMIKRRWSDRTLLAVDVGNAIEGVERGWPGQVDTLCCGSLGSIEFLCEAGDVLVREELRDLASQRLANVVAGAAEAGDFRWNSGSRQFNLGLFRGLAGVGYTLLRQVDRSLPNVLIWE